VENLATIVKEVTLLSADEIAQLVELLAAGWKTGIDSRQIKGLLFPCDVKIVSGIRI
jgi:hypothetical protein